MKKVGLVTALLLSLNALAQAAVAQTPVPKSIWRAVVVNRGGELPFGLDIQPVGSGSEGYLVHALNGPERLKLDPAKLEGDSLRIPMALFDSELIGRLSGDSLTGYYQRKRGGAWVRIPFRAKHGQTHRFVKAPAPAVVDVSGKWATYFRSPGGTDSSFAVGVFEQKQNQVTGTFLTSTGDYRYLAGDVVGDSLKLSCYDGSHLYLFKARVQNERMTGDFFAGISGYETWTAVRDENARLPDEKSLTYLKPGFDRLAFQFPNPSGKLVSLSDPKYRGKVVVVQILGSWCPNCMDETNFLVPWYGKNAKRGVEVVGLAYERSADLTESAPKLNRMKERFGIPYEVLLAGTSDKTAAAKTLPMLNAVVGYPTTIFIDKQGKVREIHTGFSGPGTGKYYDAFVEDFNRLIDKLVAE
jgi:thiol-disulfide isomerase/thioredoxin